MNKENPSSKRSSPIARKTGSLARFGGSEAILQALRQGKLDITLDLASTSVLTRQILQSLIESEARYNRLVESMSAVIFEMKPDGAAYFINSAVIRITGYSPKELQGHRWIDIFFPGERRTLLEEIARRFQSGDIASRQITLPKRDGQQVTLDFNFAIDYHPDGSLGKITGLGVDITDRKRAEEELIESKAMFERLFEVAPDATLLCDSRGHILRANRQTIQKFGYTSQELAGQPVEILLPERFRNQHIVLRKDYFLNPVTRPVGSGLDLNARTKDGHEFPVDITLSPFRKEDHDQVICVIHDLTRRKAAEALLRQSEARFRAIFSGSPVGMLVTGMDGVSLESNPALQEMLGYSAEELRRISFLDYTYPEDVEKSRELFGRMAAGEIDQYDMQKRYIRKDGRVIWGHLAISLLRKENGEPLYTVGLIENIDQRKQIEAELNEVQSRMIDSAEAERLHLAQELHDGPIQDLIGLTYRLAGLKGAVPDDQSREELSETKSVLEQVIKALRTTSGELRPPTLAPFGLEKAIRSHIDRFKQAHPELEFHLELAPDRQVLPERVRLALFRIYQQALVNVVRHANARRVGVRLALDNRQVVLEVQDDGRGFEVPDRWVVLARQGHLGLIGASERAEAIGGNLDVITSPGKGTLIRVSAPLA